MIILVANNLYMRILTRTETPENMTFWPFLFRAVILTPWLFFIPVETLTLTNILLTAGIGVTGGVGFLIMSEAYRLAPVSIASFFFYTQLITGAILGYLFWDMVPSPWVWVGAAVIFLAGLIVGHEARRQSAIVEENTEEQG